LKNLERPSDFSQEKAISLKLQEIKYCVMNENTYWKDPLGIFLDCVVEYETAGIIDRHVWKTPRLERHNI
jgi:hypothetical protein